MRKNAIELRCKNVIKKAHFGPFFAMRRNENKKGRKNKEWQNNDNTFIYNCSFIAHLLPFCVFCSVAAEYFWLSAVCGRVHNISADYLLHVNFVSRHDFLLFLPRSFVRFFVTMTTRCCLLFGVEILMDSDDYAIANAIFFSSITKHARSFLFARTFVAIDLQKKERFFAHLYRYHRFLFPLSLHLCNIFACCWLGCYHTHIFGDIRFL